MGVVTGTPDAHYRPDIDGLRAVAVLSVVAFHAFPDHVRGGFVGVDLFFVISGFLISRIIFGQLAEGGFRFGEFYARRIRRIFPALLLVLAGSLAFGWFALFAEEYRQLGTHIAAGAGFLSNIALWRESGYFDKAAEIKPLLHLWSLGIEEQFYILWPLAIWLAWKSRLNLLVLVVTAAVASFVLGLQALGSDAAGAFYAPWTRFWELLAGSVLAWLAVLGPSALRHSVSGGSAEGVNRSVVRRMAPNLLSAAGLLLVAAGLGWIHKGSPFPGTLALLPVVGAVLIIQAGPRAWINRVLLSNRVMVGVGLISYPLYLWHWPLLSFARIVEGEAPAAGIRCAAVAVALLLAWLTYRFVERPCRSATHGAAKVGMLVGLMLLVGIAGWVVASRGGLPSRAVMGQATDVQTLVAPYPHEPFRNAWCDQRFPGFRDFSACLLSQDAPPEVLLLGDSHAQQYYGSLAKRLNPQPVMSLGQWGCLPFSSGTNFASFDCEARYHAALRFAVESPSIRTVYLSGYWSYLAAGGFAVNNENYRLPRPLADTDKASFIDNGNRMVAALLAAGKQVVLLHDIPDLDFNIRTCFAKRPLSISAPELRQPCAIARADYEARTRPYADALGSVVRSHPALEAHDPLELLCDERWCHASRDGQPLYYNSDHLTAQGADAVVADLLARHPPRTR